MELITETEIIKLRDKMSTNQLREITNMTKKKHGFVDMKRIFQTMGYTHAFNDKWEKPKE